MEGIFIGLVPGTQHSMDNTRGTTELHWTTHAGIQENQILSDAWIFYTYITTTGMTILIVTLLVKASAKGVNNHFQYGSGNVYFTQYNV
jgi:hypothetical protein